jgi:hypothetical protein
MDLAPSPRFTCIRHKGRPSYGPSSEQSLGFDRVWGAFDVLILACLDLRSSDALPTRAGISAVSFPGYCLLVPCVTRTVMPAWFDRNAYASAGSDLIGQVLAIPILIFHQLARNKSHWKQAAKGSYAISLGQTPAHTSVNFHPARKGISTWMNRRFEIKQAMTPLCLPT